MKYVYVRIMWLTILLFAGGVFTSPVSGAAAFTDEEIVLGLSSVRLVNSLDAPDNPLVYSGSTFVDTGVIPAEATSTLKFVRISGQQDPGNGTEVGMVLGDMLTLDAQIGVNSAGLAAGESAAIEYDMDGVVSIANPDNDVTVRLIAFFEHEWRLNTTVADAWTESAASSVSLSISAISRDANGDVFDTFNFSFEDMQVDGDDSEPEKKFNFSIDIPSGGTGQIFVDTTSFASVAVVPEPAASAIMLGGLGMMLRRRR